MASVTGVQLQYRLWIAEMNADIDILRILGDYLGQKRVMEENEPAFRQIKHFKEIFLQLRTNLDELRHQMQLNKMQLEKLMQKPVQSLAAVKKSISHAALKKQYEVYRRLFLSTKKDFQQFENE